MSEIPATFFVASSKNAFVPESVKDIEVSGVVTSDHDLRRLPESVERLWLTITPRAIRSLPDFKFVQSLQIKLVTESDAAEVSDDDAVLLRSRFTKQLSELSLAGNAMSDNVVHQFRDCPCLESLHIEGEKFTGHGFATWPVQKALTYISVGGMIENKHMVQFPSLPNVESVDIYSKTSLAEGLKWLRNCPKINSLELSSTRVDPIGFQEVGKLQELSTLRLLNLKSIDFSALSEMVPLNRVELVRCETARGDFSTWPSTAQVFEIHLRNTNISLASLSRIPGLRSVDTDTDLSYDDLVEAGLPGSLQLFQGEYVVVSNAQLEKLKALYPTVEFRVPDAIVNRVHPTKRRFGDLMRAMTRP